MQSSKCPQASTRLGPSREAVMAFLDVCLACIRPRWLLKAMSAYPIGPRSVYDEAKRFSVVAVTAWRRYYGVDTHLARIFNTYRPSLQANDGRVISNFMMQRWQASR